MHTVHHCQLDQSAQLRRDWVSAAELADLSRIPVLRVWASIAFTWSMLLLLFYAALTIQLVAIFPIVFICNGILFLWLAYWAHEATHGLVHPDRRWNDLLGDIFLAGPFGVSVAQHRWQHGRHHVGVNDPEVEVDHTAWLCVAGPQLLIQLLLHASGWQGISTIWRYRNRPRDERFREMPRRSMASMFSLIAVNGGVLALCIAYSQWYLYVFLWVLPFITVTVALMNLFNVVHHQSSSAVCEDGRIWMPPITRVVNSGLLERMVIAPIGSYYHLEHHEYPSVPAFRLAELRKLLLERGRFVQADILWADGYLRTLWRMARDPHYAART